MYFLHHCFLHLFYASKMVTSSGHSIIFFFFCVCPYICLFLRPILVNIISQEPHQEISPSLIQLDSKMNDCRICWSEVCIWNATYHYHLSGVSSNLVQVFIITPRSWWALLLTSWHINLFYEAIVLIHVLYIWHVFLFFSIWQLILMPLSIICQIVKGTLVTWQ